MATTSTPPRINHFDLIKSSSLKNESRLQLTRKALSPSCEAAGLGIQHVTTAHWECECCLVTCNAKRQGKIARKSASFYHAHALYNMMRIISSRGEISTCRHCRSDSRLSNLSVFLLLTNKVAGCLPGWLFSKGAGSPCCGLRPCTPFSPAEIYGASALLGHGHPGLIRSQARVPWMTLNREGSMRDHR